MKMLPPEWEQLWECTRSGNEVTDEVTFHALEWLYDNRTKKGTWFHNPFRVEKKNKQGQFRLISWAGPQLSIVHLAISRWLKHEYVRKSMDASTPGAGGVMVALRAHGDNKFVTLVDVANAFSSVSERSLSAALRCLMDDVTEEFLDVLLELTTVDGHVWQGWSVSSDLFNLVMLNLDPVVFDQLPFLGVEIYTRYVDNLIFSSSKPYSPITLERFLRHVFKQCGFLLGPFQHSDQGRYSYLGVMVEEGNYRPQDVKRYVVEIEKALQHPCPHLYYWTILGYFSWTLSVSRDNIPKELFEVFERYFKLVGMIPPALQRLMIMRYQMSFADLQN